VDGDVSRWFDDYLAVFAACGRGERPITDVLDYYRAPLLLSTDDVVLTLSTVDDVAAWVQSQVDGRSRRATTTARFSTATSPS
jgi:uncharacterized NTF2-like protein DUF6841